MPITMAEAGASYQVKAIRGRSEMHMHLESLGLVPGSVVQLIARTPSGLILNVRGSRIALAFSLADRVLV